MMHIEQLVRYDIKCYKRFDLFLLNINFFVDKTIKILSKNWYKSQSHEFEPHEHHIGGVS